MLAVEFVNTEYLVRGRRHDAIGSPAQLVDWLRQHLPGAASGQLTAGQLTAFHALRVAVRGLCEAALTATPADRAHLDAVNRAAAAAARWPALSQAGARYLVREATAASFPATALGAIAGDAARLLGGPQPAPLGACASPGCVQLFVRDHPRRRWCSAACGNRARVARHHRRAGHPPPVA